jgi:hypothetical protein
MRSNSIASGLLAASLCVACAAWVRWQQAAPKVQPDRSSIASRRSFAPSVSDSALADAEEFTVANDPFRLSNIPPTVRYDPANDGGSSGLGTPPPPPVRPVLILKAIVGGPPWQAVIDGIPGQPAGTVAHSGSKFEKLTVRAVTRDSVIVQGPDTAWVLSFRGRS